MTSASANHEQPLPPDVEMAFAPLHKRAFGMAIGIAAALVCFLVTAVYLVRRPQPGFDLGLLDHFFYGYTVSWRGAVIAAAWGAFAGFVAGWFVAFVRNLALGILVFVTRTRSEMAATRDFLDHI
jgi:hypothetical protein